MLFRFVDQLGWIFKFVKDDVVDKLGILQDFVDADRSVGGEKFETIQSAIDYETRQKLIESNPRNFSRTLLRLHRALLFILLFLRSLVEQPTSRNTSDIAHQSYNETLAHHRQWLFLSFVSVEWHFLFI